MQELLNVKAAGTYRDHSALKGKLKQSSWQYTWLHIRVIDKNYF
jgi:hypothetical protein